MGNLTGTEAARQTGGKTFTRMLSILFLVTSVFAAIGKLSTWRGQPWAEVLWITLGAALTFAWLNRSLPLQNILLAMATMSGVGIVAILTAEAGRSGNQLHLGLAATPSPAPANLLEAVAWALLLLNAQGVARLLAVRKENSPSYGLWVLGLASALACGFQLGLGEAVSQPANKTWALVVASVVGWYCFAFFCLTLASPALLKRKPGTRVLSLEPVWVWIGFSLLVMATAAGRGLWTIIVFQGALMVLGAWAGLRAFRAR